MKKLIAVIILALVSMSVMADEGKVNGKAFPNASMVQAKLEQILQDRMQSILAENNAEARKHLDSAGGDTLLIHTMDYFKLDTSVPE